jgi:hypothetical protein
MDKRIDHAHNRSWTNYVTIDPVKLLQNIFGGGDVQKDKIVIARDEAVRELLQLT